VTAKGFPGLKAVDVDALTQFLSSDAAGRIVVIGFYDTRGLLCAWATGSKSDYDAVLRRAQDERASYMAKHPKNPLGEAPIVSGRIHDEER
jgi:hypothetical protein